MADLGGCVTLWGGVIAIAKPESAKIDHGEPSPPAPSLETVQRSLHDCSSSRRSVLDGSDCWPGSYGVEIEVVGVDIMPGIVVRQPDNSWEPPRRSIFTERTVVDNTVRAL